MSDEIPIGATHHCEVCGEEDYPAFHVCVPALKSAIKSRDERIRALEAGLNALFDRFLLDYDDFVKRYGFGPEYAAEKAKALLSKSEAGKAVDCGS